MTVVLYLAGVWVAVSIPLALAVAHALGRLDSEPITPEPPARHLHLVRS